MSNNRILNQLERSAQRMRRFCSSLCRPYPPPSNRGIIRCPYDDDEDEKRIKRDILNLVLGTMNMAAACLGIGSSLFVLITKFDSIALTESSDVMSGTLILALGSVFCLISCILQTCMLLNTTRLKAHSLIEVTLEIYTNFRKAREIKQPIYQIIFQDYRKPIHKMKKLFLVIIISSITVALTAAGGFMNAMVRSKIPIIVKRVANNGMKVYRLLQSMYENDLKTILETAMQSYTTLAIQSHWDAIQTKYGCCGINNSSDWLRYRDQLPTTCCKNADNSCILHDQGCLAVLGAEIAYIASYTAAINFILMVIMFSVMIARIWVLYAEDDFLVPEQSPSQCQRREISTISLRKDGKKKQALSAKTHPKISCSKRFTETVAIHVTQSLQSTSFSSI